MDKVKQLKLLKDTRNVVEKLADSSGVDYEELNENYHRIYDRLDEAIQILEGDK